VKIDNVPEALPQTGLGSADVIYVEPVEGGLTRLIAVYFGRPPAVVGPVRSARGSDLGLLPQYGRPTLAYSGAAPELLPSLAAAPLVNASPAQFPQAYFRDDTRPAPHNLYVRPGLLPRGQPPDATPGPHTFGPAPGPGVAATAYQVRYPAATFDFVWSAPARRWSISLAGAPLESTESGPVTAATVVEQRVEVRPGDPTESGVVNGSPLARTVGTGDAVVLRDGQRYPATWVRPSPDAPTRFRTPAGDPLPLAPGPVWILLTPA
jgi:hypothetical protein